MKSYSGKARQSAGRVRRAMARRVLSAAVAATPAIVLLFSAERASAQLYWDTNGTGTGATSAGNTAPGTWGADNFWSTSSNGSAATAAWTPGGLAVFSAGTNASGTFTVTVSGTQQVGGLTVQEGNVTLSGGEINLASAGTTFNIAVGTSTITSVITSAPSGNRLIKTGAGTLQIGTDVSQENVYDGGTTVSAGKLVFHGEPNPGALALNPLGLVPATPVANHIILQSGGILSSLRDTVDNRFLASARGITIGAGGGTLDVANAAASLNYQGVIAGSDRWTKSGPGTLRLTSGANIFTGGFRVTGGILEHSQFEATSPPAGNPSGSGAQPASVVPNWVILDGGTIKDGRVSTTSTFLPTNKGITLGASGGGVWVDDTANSVDSQSSTYFGVVTGPGTLYKRGKGEFRAGAGGWTNTKLVVESGLFRIATGSSDTGFGATPAAYIADAISLQGAGTTRASGGAAIGASAAFTTAATRGITIGANGATFVNNSTWQINSIITGPGNFSLEGNGWLGSSGSFLILTGANTWQGGTKINRGTLVVRNGNAIPDNSAVVFTTETISGQPLPFTTRLRVDDDETVGSISAPDGFAAITIELNTGNLTAGGNNASTSFGGVIKDGPSGSGNVIKTGTGTWTLTGDNTFTGDIIVNAGTLLVNNTSGSGAGTGDAIINSSAILDGMGNLDNSNVIINSGGHLAPGSSLGTLSVNELTIEPGSILDYELAAPTTGDKIDIEFGLTLNGGTLNVSDSGGISAGTYVLMDYGTLDGGAAGSLSLGTTPAGFNYNIVDSGSSIDLVVSAAGGASKIWAVNAGGLWSLDSNWSTVGKPNGIDHAASFLGIISANRIVTNDAAHTVGTINFNDNNSYEIAGSSTLTLNVSSGSAIINVDGGNHTISAPLALAGNTIVDVTGGSTLTVSKLQNSSVSVTKTGTGKLAVNGVRAAALSVSAGEVEVLTSVNTNTNASRVSSLSISVGATFDLNDSDLIVDGGNYSAIQSLVIQGYNNGNWLGTGITSSAAATNASLFALGVADNDDLNNTEFSGQVDLDGDEVLVKFTYVGDANLTGGVNLDDFNQFLFGFNPANAAPQIWLNGDFNYTGAVNLDDFNLFLFGLANQGGSLVSPELFAALSAFASVEGIDVDLSTVPEPQMALLALGSLLLSRRRRRA